MITNEPFHPPSLVDPGQLRSHRAPPPIPPAHMRANTPFVPFPRIQTLSNYHDGGERYRAVSEVPHSITTTEVNQPFVRAASVRPGPSSKSILPLNGSYGLTLPIKTFVHPSPNPFSRVNEAFVPPPTSHRTIPLPRPVKIERFTASPRPNIPQGPLTPISKSSNVGLMLPPPVPDRSSSVGLGKRKAEVELPRTPTSSNRPGWNRPGSVSIKKEHSSTPDVKPSIPVQILPVPLPSKRFKKKATSKAVLIPVEQLPVYALPPLPEIEDENLVKQVFTHSSMFEKTRGRFEDPVDNPAKHYEKLEHVGDSILGMVVTTWLHESKPNLTIGTATKLKSHLVSNATLSHLSGLYNFPQRLNGDPNLLPVLRAQTDVRAALMEAYIAALYFAFPISVRLNEGIQTIDSWLREMYEPLYDFFYLYMKKEHEQHHTTAGSTIDGQALLLSEVEMARIDEAARGMSALVQMYANEQERELCYQEERYETNIGALWKTKCTVDGIELGEAMRVDKKVARNVAAWEAAKKLRLTEEAA